MSFDSDDSLGHGGFVGWEVGLGSEISVVIHPPRETPASSSGLKNNMLNQRIFF